MRNREAHVVMNASVAPEHDCLAQTGMNIRSQDSTRFLLELGVNRRSKIFDFNSPTFPPTDVLVSSRKG